ncbi:starvation-inducible DNA-binding protein [Bradyrhizobium sp. LM6.9]
MSLEDARKRLEAPLDTPSNLGSNATKDISAALTALMADVFALYVKTKNFHWHMSGPHFRDYHLLLDEQAEQIFAMTDEIAERARKTGGTTIRSIGHIARVKHIGDNDADFVTPEDMLAELKEDNLALTQRMRQTHNCLRRSWRCRHGQPDRKLDRRGGTSHMVSVRDNQESLTPSARQLANPG